MRVIRAALMPTITDLTKSSPSIACAQAVVPNRQSPPPVLSTKEAIASELNFTADTIPSTSDTFSNDLSGSCTVKLLLSNDNCSLTTRHKEGFTAILIRAGSNSVENPGM